ncbi:MAG: N-acetyltransferase [Candidatus Diapherotrites archaeon]|nr:N-acetyltransferase [Candidatus Diapherotrites archaeon]
MNHMITIRESIESDLEQIFFIEYSAFKKEGKEIAKLVKNLLSDSTAKPALSLIAFEKNLAVGHILFTKAYIMPKKNISAMILAPLAVIPKAQKKGIGSKLIKTGLKKLSKSGIELVFVLGHPTYYSRYGFKPAEQFSLKAPYPIAQKNKDAWMVKKLKEINEISGKVICAKSLKKPKYWKE